MRIGQLDVGDADARLGAEIGEPTASRTENPDRRVVARGGDREAQNEQLTPTEHARVVEQPERPLR